MGTTAWSTKQTSAQVAKEEMSKLGVLVQGPRRHDGAFWAIVQHTSMNRPFLLCYLVSKSRGDVYVKEMSADMGPWYRPPKAMLNTYIGIVEKQQVELSKTEQEWIAAEQNRPAKPVVKKGDTIRYPHKIEFTSGFKEDTFTYLGGYRFRASNGYTVRFNKKWRTQDDYTLVSHGENV